MCSQQQQQHEREASVSSFPPSLPAVSITRDSPLTTGAASRTTATMMATTTATEQGHTYDFRRAALLTNLSQTLRIMDQEDACQEEQDQEEDNSSLEQRRLRRPTTNSPTQPFVPSSIAELLEVLQRDIFLVDDGDDEERRDTVFRPVEISFPTMCCWEDHNDGDLSTLSDLSSCQDNDDELSCIFGEEDENSCTPSEHMDRFLERYESNLAVALKRLYDNEDDNRTGTEDEEDQDDDDSQLREELSLLLQQQGIFGECDSRCYYRKKKQQQQDCSLLFCPAA